MHLQKHQNFKAMDQELKKAYGIAASSLRSNYGELGIKTGSLRDTYWSWDSFFASYGSVELGDYGIVRENFETFLRYQDNDGCLPRRISAPLIFYHLNFLTKKAHPKIKKPSYSAFPFFQKPRFQNLVFIISLANYIRKSKDTEFIIRHRDKIIKAFSFIEKGADKNSLIAEGIFCNWSETILKKGYVLFTNTLYYKALTEMDYLSKHLGEKDNGYYAAAMKIKRIINAKFWNNSYYSDFISGERFSDIFYTDGNISAVLFGICGKADSLKIQKYISDFRLDSVPSKTNHQKYKSKDIFFINNFVNKDYHNGASWLWLGFLDAAAKKKAGLWKDAISELKRIARIIVNHGSVYELYDDSGNPYGNRLYSAEKNFAWSSGMFIWACHEVFNKKQKEKLLLI